MIMHRILKWRKGHNWRIVKIVLLSIQCSSELRISFLELCLSSRYLFLFEYTGAKLPIANSLYWVVLNYTESPGYSGNYNLHVQLDQSIHIYKTLFISNGSRHRAPKGNTTISVCHQPTHENLGKMPDWKDRLGLETGQLADSTAPWGSMPTSYEWMGKTCIDNSNKYWFLLVFVGEKIMSAQGQQWYLRSILASSSPHPRSS